MRMWVLESGYGNIRTTVWDGAKYRNVGIGVFVWELHVRNVGMGMWEPEYRNQVWEHGSVGTRVWEPTYWNGNMGTTVLEWDHSMGTWVLEYGYGNGGSQLSMGMWVPRYGNVGIGITQI